MPSYDINNSMMGFETSFKGCIFSVSGAEKFDLKLLIEEIDSVNVP